MNGHAESKSEKRRKGYLTDVRQRSGGAGNAAYGEKKRCEMGQGKKVSVGRGRSRGKEGTGRPL